MIERASKSVSTKKLSAYTAALRKVNKVNSDFLEPRDTLNSNKRKLLEILLKEEGFQGTKIQPQALPRETRPEHLPLSFAQKRLWFLDQLEADKAVYNIPFLYHLTGNLHKPALEAAFNEILRRHEVLHATFREIHGMPVQIIAPFTSFKIPEIDFTARPKDQRNRLVQQFIAEEARKPFNLQQGPLLRIHLLHVKDEHAILLIVLHHIISDGWSMNIVARELSAFYTASVQGKASPLSPLPIQYTDFAILQQQWLQTGELEKQLAYWKEQLAGDLTILQLPLDAPRPAVQTYQGANFYFHIPPTLTSRIKKLSRQENCTLFMTLLAVFQMLLFHYTGMDDILVGSPTANRNRIEIEPLIGFFVNTLVLRTHLSTTITFQELLAQVREVAVEAYAHQDIPFESLVEHLRPRRDLSHTPLFQVMFVLQDTLSQQLSLPDITMRVEEAENGTAKFDLTIFLEEHEQGLQGKIEYNTDLFQQATIARIQQHFLNLLENVVAHPADPLWKISLLSEKEKQKMLFEWNATQSDYPKQCFHELFAAQVKRTPAATALVYKEEELTYRILDEKANQLAFVLQQQGVGSDQLVGLCMNRTPDMLIGLLGILKAGGAYVPLDPTHPKARLDFILQDAHLAVLVTHSTHLQHFSEHDFPIICLDQISFTEQNEGTHKNITHQAQLQNLAYVLYTSGSTGMPKGVMVHHQGLVNYLWWASQAYAADTGLGTPVHSSVGFDLTITSLLLPLLSGQRVVFLPEDQEREALRYALQQGQEYTLVKLTPSHLEMLQLTSVSYEALENTHAFIIGGEALLKEQIVFWQTHTPKIRLINEYGPTETVVGCSIYEVSPNVKEISGIIPIGRPIANMQLYLLDAALNPVPIGVQGEIYIGGIGVARGYSNRPDLTAERFIPHPFSEQPGARLYKTGDLAKYRVDGVIEFLGRQDNQVKVRGFRIELGEIEAALRNIALIAQCVVLLQEESHHDQHLIAYIELHRGATLSIQETRQALREYLPEYMLPSDFVFLEALPLTENGKLDRRALPRLEDIQIERLTHLSSPRTVTEQLLVSIWSDLLHKERIGIHDNFFDLGGHSLLGAQLVARLRSTFNVELPIRHLFEAPTIAELARFVEQGTGKQSASISPFLHTEEVPLSFAQQRLWFLYQLDPESVAYNVPSVNRLSGKLRVDYLEAAFNKIIQRHEILRTTFVQQADKPVQVIKAHLELPITIIDLTSLRPEEREARAQHSINDAIKQPFDLCQGPLLRMQLFKLQEDEYIFLVLLHHIVSDGWSMHLLNYELSTFYTAALHHQEMSLPTLPIQYADFALWQREWLLTGEQERQLTYWKKQLAGELSIMKIATDRPRHTPPTHQGALHFFRLESSLTSQLKLLSRQEGATLFMTLLAIFQLLLSRYSGQEDILVGSPIANRNHTEIETLIGFFVNTVVLRTTMEGNPDFRELLKHVRETALGAYAHQDVPFERVVEALRPERKLEYNPLFQVMFDVQSDPIELPDLPGINAQPLDFEIEMAKFDLIFDIIEDNDTLLGRLEYNQDLFDANAIQRLAQHFHTLCISITTQPDQSISTLSLVSDTERAQLETFWYANKTSFPKDLCFHQLFEKQAQKTPDAIAVVCGDTRLTYAELHIRSNQLAHYLQKQGVTAEVRVGLIFEKSVELVISLLGILKAGGAYVPIDPTYPIERQSFMLVNSEAFLVLTQPNLLPQLSHIPHVTFVEVAMDWQRFAQEAPSSPANTTSPENIAYLIYTSGTTSQPKGVMVQHRSLVNAYGAWEKAYSLRSIGTSHLQMANSSFDVFSGDVIRALASGAKLVLCSRDLLLESKKLYELMLEEQIDCAEFVPAVLRNLLDYLDATNQKLFFMHLLVVGSDTWQMSEYRKLQACCGPDTRILNSYGVTEASIDSLYYEAQNGDEPGDSYVPIGRPLPDIEAILLDHSLMPVPPGIPGSLYIGGEGVARGYARRSDLTAERFIPHPFAKQPGMRLYKTGDLARYRSDGTLEFLGRSDYQVKIRGFRVELGEVETALASLPEVQQSIVHLKNTDFQDQRLVAYLILHTGASLSPEQIRPRLQAILPAYMLPTAFVFLSAFPMTPNGKIDRLALPDPETYETEMLTPSQAPLTPIEELIASHWCDLLHLERIGRHDNFFALGGHSLLVTQLLVRLRSTFHIELPIKSLFQSPTIAGIASTLAQVRQRGDGRDIPAIRPIKQTGTAPLSFAQQRLWFLHQLDPDSTAYTIPTLLHITGDLQVDILKTTLGEIIRRHETLRTTFAMEHGNPQQVIEPSHEVSLLLIDLTHLSAEDAENTSTQHIQNEIRRPFDLQQGPLLRVQLLQMAAHTYILLLNMHHIIADEWSMNIFMHELTTIYDAFACQQPSPLQELPIQYASFATWQRDWLQGDVLIHQLHYWKEQLAGELPPLQLPTDFPRSTERRYRGAIYQFPVAFTEARQLQQVSKAERVTEFMFLLTVFQTLLHRYNGLHVILVGSPIANRNHPEIENMIGFFVNVQLLHTDFSGHPTFKEMLQRVREVALGAYAHQDIPFEKVVEIMRPEHEQSMHSPFQIAFVFQRDAQDRYSMRGLDITLQDAYNETAKFDITFSLKMADDTLNGVIEYNRDLFRSQTIQRLAEHFQNILSAALTNTQQNICDLPLLSAYEQQQILVDWNASQTPYPEKSCFHFLFQEQVSNTPMAIAVVDGQRSLTYQELNTRANQLAHYLQKQGIGPEVLVGVCLERSLELIIALLAILKAGGAYVPVDPIYPRERKNFMLLDSHTSLVLTQESLKDGLPLVQADVICLEKEWPLIEQEDGDNPDSGVLHSNTAYVIYTSGSTGKPKGVAIEHKGLGNVLQAQKNAFQIAPGEHVLQFASISFDASVFEMTMALLTGATLYLIPAETILSGARFLQFLQDQAISIVTLPPSFLAALPAEQEMAQLPSLRTVIVAGERCPAEIVERWGKNRRFFNAYGPTETTIWATLSQCWSTSGAPSIGKPIANQRVYILDPNLNPLPAGFSGEIYIGGIGVARGYLERPELTAERFLPDPFSKQPGERFYKTGDVGRFLPDGTLELLGRIDHQVKLRGFRIELGEIESALASHPKVQSGVVVVHETKTHDQRLIAYAVPNAGSHLSSEEMRDYLRERLPAYMLPSSVVELDALPLMPNGKVDRQALAHKQPQLTGTTTTFVAPQSEIERSIAAIWQEVLGIDHIGREDNFFDLGGHSLLLVQVQQKIQDTLHIQCSIIDIFKYPNIHSLAQKVGNDFHEHETTLQQSQQRAQKRREADLRQKRITKGR
jgi:amino acid adenylation domain-containing protein